MTSNVNSNVTVSTQANAEISEVIQGINFYTICFEISSWTSERCIAPEEMEQFASAGVPTPVLDALREKKLGKGRITTYDPDALKIFDAYRGRIRDKLRDLNSFPLMGGSYVFCDEQKYKEALAFIADQEPQYWKDFAEFQKNYDTVLIRNIDSLLSQNLFLRSGYLGSFHTTICRMKTYCQRRARRSYLRLFLVTSKSTLSSAARKTPKNLLG